MYGEQMWNQSPAGRSGLALHFLLKKVNQGDTALQPEDSRSETPCEVKSGSSLEHLYRTGSLCLQGLIEMKNKSRERLHLLTSLNLSVHLPLGATWVWAQLSEHFCGNADCKGSGAAAYLRLRSVSPSTQVCNTSLLLFFSFYFLAHRISFLTGYIFNICLL